MPCKNLKSDYGQYITVMTEKLKRELNKQLRIKDHRDRTQILRGSLTHEQE